MSNHTQHYTIPAMDTGVTPVGEYEKYCVDCEQFFEEN